MTKANECTCPSGDGSLRHPCPAHPAVEQPIAALAQPSLVPPDRGPWHAVKWDGGRRVDLSSDDFEHDVALTVSGDFVEGDKFRYAQELAAWMNAHLAQPSPVQAEQHWPKLEKPAQVGAIRFHAGLSSRLVVEAAQRLYEFESTPEKEAERIERLQAFREQLDPLNLAPHAGAFNEAPAEALKPEQAEAERPEVVAWQYRVTAGPQTGWSLWHPGKGEEFERSYTVERRPLMTIAQHEYIVGELWAVIAQLRQHKNDYMDSGQETYRALQNEIREREAEIARLDGLVSGRTAERDAALARVAELERGKVYVEARRCDECQHGGINDSATGVAACHECDWTGPEPEEDKCPGCQRENCMAAACPQCGARYVLVASEEIAAPVAQAQHSVPEEFSFEYRHPNGECHTVTVSREQVINEMPDFLFEALCSKFCNCEPVGETNVVECCCDEYAEEFKLIAAAPGKEGV